MDKPWLLLDCNYLCHRAWHSMGNALSYSDEPTVVIYGFFKDVSALLAEFQTDQVVFCFDCGYGKRLELLPSYKSRRAAAHVDDSEEERQARLAFGRQVRRLREQYLAVLGYRNVCWQEGYEADDVIASLVRRTLGDNDQAVIVSSDHDLWQLISARVSCYNPQTRVLLDRAGFTAKWGIDPALWCNVKAIAGCATDDVPGLRGVGESTAVKWFSNKLKPTSAAYKKINTEGIEVHNRNIKLVRLPFEGCQTFQLVPDDVTREKWQALADRLGMQSIRDAMPGQPRGVRAKAVQTQKKRSSVGFGF